MADKHRVMQQTIAQKLGLSQCTVNKVLNHDPRYRCSQETRDLVLRTAKEMGLQSRRRRTNNIAFVACGYWGAGSTVFELYRAVSREAGRLGKRAYLVEAGENPTYEEISLLANPIIADGVILVGSSGYPDPEMVREVSKVMPVLLWQDPGFSFEFVDKVYIDLEELCRSVTEHLVANGHRDIALIVHSMAEDDGQPFLAGYKDVLERHGIRFDPAMVFTKEMKRYPDLISTIMSHTPRPTAILSSSLTDHPTVMSTLLAMGYDVPADVSYATWACPDYTALRALSPITRMHDPFEIWAATAVGTLLKRVECRDMPAVTISVRGNLLSGETVKDMAAAEKTLT